MKKSYKKKLIKQISRLCEKQYRKGFQQGFYAHKNKLLTKEEVDIFRDKGAEQGYKKVVDPFDDIVEPLIDRLRAESYMSGMDELLELLGEAS